MNSYGYLRITDKLRPLPWLYTLAMLFCVHVSNNVLAYGSPQEAEKYTFNFPEQALSESLITIGKRAKVTIIFSAKSIEGIAAPPLNGTYSAEQAIKLVTAECKCEIRPIHSNVYSLIENKPDSPPPRELDSYPTEEVLITAVKRTGSHIHKPYEYGTVSLVLYSSEDIERSGTEFIPSLLAKNPIVTGATSSTAVSNGGDGTATISLRGLPVDNTLVLVNGKRVVTSGIANQHYDLYSLPFFAVNRVEIMKDGTSAVYGSDAIGGTVNVILNDEFDGFSAEQFAGQTGHEDMETLHTRVQWGANRDGLSAYVAGSFFHQNGLYSTDRALSASADTRELGGEDRRVAETPASRITFADGTVLTPNEDYESGLAISQRFRVATNEDLYDYAQRTTSISPARRAGIYAIIKKELEDNTEFRASLSHIDTNSVTVLAPTPVTSSNAVYPFTVSADNIYNPFDEQINDIDRRFMEGSDRVRELIGRYYDLLFELEGNFDQSFWSLSLKWNKAHSVEKVHNLVDGHKLVRALGDSTNCQGLSVDGCVPVNLFGQAGSITQEQLDYVLTDSYTDGASDLISINFDFDTDLSDFVNQPLLVALGLELRKERSYITTRDYSQDMFIIGNSEFPQVRGERNIKELYFEADYSLPLFNREEHENALEFALRYSNYDDFGDNVSPRVGLRLKPIDQLTLQGSYSESFHAPSFVETQEGRTRSYQNIKDPCGNPEIQFIPHDCIRLVENYSRQRIVEYYGNKDLKAEQADSKTIGLIWSPLNFDQLNIGFDHYKIKQKNVVHAISPQLIAAQSAFYAEHPWVIRNELGEISRIFTTYMNSGTRDLSGYDLSINYKIPVTEGEIDLRFNGTYISKYIVYSSMDQQARDVGGTFHDAGDNGPGALPHRKANGRITFKNKRFDISYNFLYVGSIGEIIEEAPVEVRHNIEPWLTHNVSVMHRAYEDKLRFTVGVNNILDTPPPYSQTAFNDNHDSRTHDIWGQFWYFRLNYNFE